MDLEKERVRVIEGEEVKDFSLIYTLTLCGAKVRLW